MNENMIQEVEMSIEEARKVVNRGRKAEQLARNSLFKELIMDGYFVDECARLVHLSSDPAIPEDIRNTVFRDMAGPGALKRYFSTIVQMGRLAERDILESTETLEELREEELNDLVSEA